VAHPECCGLAGALRPVDLASDPALEGSAPPGVRADEPLLPGGDPRPPVTAPPHDAIAMLDLEGRFLAANQKLALMAGFDREEDLLASGKDCFDLLAPEDRQRARDNIREFVETGIARSIEYWGIRRDGSRIPTEISGSLMRDPCGNPRAMIVVIRDVTERTQIAAALRQSEELYRSVVENIDVGIAVVDSDHTILAVNRALARMVGRPPRELMGLKCFREFEKRPAICGHCAGAKAMATGRPASRETEGVRDDGGRFPVRIQAFPLFGPDGTSHRFIELVEDIAQRKRAGALLQRAKEAAERASHAKTEFLANMSHEIRTPLTAILGYADLLLDGAEPAQVQEAADTIKRNGQHLLAIINDILDISKIEAGRLEPEPRSCSPHRVVEEIVSLLRGRAEAKGLRMAADFDGPIPETIHTDPVRLRQILANLLGNAIKFTEIGGVRLVTRLVRQPDAPPLLRFDVRDTGLGLTENQIGLLFKPFSQADASIQRSYGGTGLGLAISRRLAELLGGGISVTSTPGIGSTFSVTVATGPLEGVRMVEGVQPAPLAPPSAVPDDIRLACRVLLAEDGPDNRRLISRVLGKLGAEVTVAENGQAALDAALAAQRDARPFDLILMDIQMPVMDGYEATGRLRQAGFTGPIIALTAHALLEDQQKCLAAGCDDYMSKPVVARDLVQRIAAHLARETPA